MASVDVRQPLEVTEIQFADDYSLVGDTENNLLSIKRISDGQSRVIATKADVPSLIKALNLSTRFW